MPEMDVTVSLPDTYGQIRNCSVRRPSVTHAQRDRLSSSQGRHYLHVAPEALLLPAVSASSLFTSCRLLAHAARDTPAMAAPSSSFADDLLASLDQAQAELNSLMTTPGNSDAAPTGIPLRNS
jgi:hypothetical protein